MANTISSAVEIPIHLKGAFSDTGKVYRYIITIDTDADLTVRSPAAGNHVGVVGGSCIQGTAFNLIWKSGSTTMEDEDYSANGGYQKRINFNDGAVEHITNAGEDLIIRSANTLDSFTLYVIEFARLGQ